jgi:hypothetical protein
VRPPDRFRSKPTPGDARFPRQAKHERDAPNDVVIAAAPESVRGPEPKYAVTVGMSAVERRPDEGLRWS